MNTDTKLGKIRIRKPTAAPRAAQSAPTFRVDRPLAGLKVGIRTDPSWLSWTFMAGLWAEFLKRDGAQPSLFPIVEHVGPDGERAIAALGAWAETQDFLAVGIGT